MPKARTKRHDKAEKFILRDNWCIDLCEVHDEWFEKGFAGIGAVWVVPGKW